MTYLVSIDFQVPVPRRPDLRFEKPMYLYDCCHGKLLWLDILEALSFTVGFSVDVLKTGLKEMM